MKKLDDSGAVLIIAYITLTVLLTLSAGFALSTFSVLNHASRYRDSVKAFWLAEAGVNQFMNDPQMLDKSKSIVFTDESGTVHISRNDSNPRVRLVRATGNVRGIERTVQITYPAEAPRVFKNTINVNGDISIVGNKSTVLLNDKTRLSGKVSYSAKHSTIYFEDVRQNIPGGQLGLYYPDFNRNGTPDEFTDFVLFNRNLLATYPEDEIVYLQGEGTFTIEPNDSLVGKKIIFVEGSEGKGDVLIRFSGGWGEDENLTIISTGSVTLNQMGATPSSSQLNIIAWSDYYEVSVLPGSHNGMIFTHGIAHFDDIHDTSITNGCVVANGGVVFGEIWSTKTFNFKDTRIKGKVPPGFEGLMGLGSTGYLSTPSSWKEI